MEFINEFELRILQLITEFDSLFEATKIQGATILTWLWWIITQFGDKFVIIGVIAIMYWCINKEKGEKIAFSVMSTFLVNSTLKTFINRPRPFTYDPTINKLGDLSNPSGSSFPSGHSQNATTTFASLALHERNLFTLISAIVLITLIPLSRLYLGVHYPSDVIIGVLTGLLVSYLAYLLMTYCYRHKFLIYIITLVLFTPVLFFDMDGDTAHNLYASYGVYAGFIGGIFIENKFINFTCDVSVKTKILRLLIGVGIAVGAYLIYKLGDKLIIEKFAEGNYILDNIYTAVGYGVISLLAFGIIPFIFKKQKR